MSYYVLKNGQQEGPHDERVVRQLLDAGNFLPSDLAFRDGMSQWWPLGEVLGLQFVPPPLPGGEPLLAPAPTVAPAMALPSPVKSRPSKDEQPQSVIVTDINMPFGSMVLFIMKWSLAAIPALLLLGVTLALAWGLFMALVAGIFAHFH